MRSKFFTTTPWNRRNGIIPLAAFINRNFFGLENADLWNNQTCHKRPFLRQIDCFNFMKFWCFHFEGVFTKDASEDAGKGVLSSCLVQADNYTDAEFDFLEALAKEK